MKKIFIVVIVLILTVVAFLFFQLRKKTETPVIPAETQPLNIYIDNTTKEKLVDHLEKIEPGIKRFKVYSGDMNVLPPCPEDTHEENGFCRKDLSIYIGAKSVDLDISCRPDQCDVQCKKACEDTAGENCMLNEDISKECLKSFPPEEQAKDEAELREQGIQCRSRYDAYYQHYRCRYSTSEHELFRLNRTASDEECRQMYDAYQKCWEALPERKAAPGKIYPSSEEVMRCTNILSFDFAPAGCEIAWTEPDKRPYGRAVADKVICNFTCF